jgi:hypothetical protein
MLAAWAGALAPVLPQARAAETDRPAGWQAMDDKAPSLPLTASFDKGTDPNAGPYVLNLTNTSKESLVVEANIHLSVAFHASRKDRKIPNHTIEAGQTWTIADLAAGDKVVLTADGFAALELTVP